MTYSTIFLSCLGHRSAGLWNLSSPEPVGTDCGPNAGRTCGSDRHGPDAGIPELRHVPPEESTPGCSPRHLPCLQGPRPCLFSAFLQAAASQLPPSSASPSPSSPAATGTAITVTAGPVGVVPEEPLCRGPRQRARDPRLCGDTVPVLAADAETQAHAWSGLTRPRSPLAVREPRGGRLLAASRKPS